MLRYDYLCPYHRRRVDDARPWPSFGTDTAYRRLLRIKTHRLDNFFCKSYFSLLEKIIIFINLLTCQETHKNNNKSILLKGQARSFCCFVAAWRYRRRSSRNALKLRIPIGNMCGNFMIALWPSFAIAGSKSYPKKFYNGLSIQKVDNTLRYQFTFDIVGNDMTAFFQDDIFIRRLEQPVDQFFFLKRYRLIRF